MSLKENKQQWDELGRLDPLWAMTGTNKFGAWDLEEFLQTGDSQVAHLMQDAKRLGHPINHEAVLDFGCGMGRLARSFCVHFDRYMGLDISDSLIAKARELHIALPNASFAVSADKNLTNLAANTFDMVHCWAVFQHVANRALVQNFISEFVRVLRKEGLLVFSAMHNIRLLYRLQPRRRAYALLRALGIPDTLLYNQLKLYPQQVHFIPESQVIAHLQKLGMRVLEVKPDAPLEAPHQVRVYYATK